MSPRRGTSFLSMPSMAARKLVATRALRLASCQARVAMTKSAWCHTVDVLAMMTSVAGSLATALQRIHAAFSVPAKPFFELSGNGLKDGRRGGPEQDGAGLAVHLDTILMERKSTNLSPRACG